MGHETAGKRMNIQEAKQEIKNALLVYHRKDAQGNYRYPLVRQRPIFLVGPPGIGKTAIMEQAAAECGAGLVAYTITHHTRQSAIGLPRIVSRSYGGQQMSITEYTLSEIVASVYDCMERTGKCEGILFIDEINCVSETLAPTMLQFLQNKSFGNHKIPEGWMIVAAGNPPEYNRSVREFDMATLDRVRKIEVKADCDVWLQYGEQHGIHRAILSYLSMKKDRFYQVRDMADGREFVTARGWEDLSQLLLGYEELGLPVGMAQMQQFLYLEDTARDFSAYYHLYCKYGQDYEVPAILDGTLPESRRRAKAELARAAAFEERFTVTELLIDTLKNDFDTWAMMEQFVQELHGILKDLIGRNADEKARMDEADGDICGLKRLAQKRKAALAIKIQNELIGGEDVQQEKKILDVLEQFSARLQELHVRKREEGFEQVRLMFGAITEELQQMAERIRERLERAFAFAEESFGDQQEMILLVSSLAGNERSAGFIQQYGCDACLKYSSLLTGERTEEELQTACRQMIRETEDGQQV